MVRTPAWPPASRIRLFIDQPLATGLAVSVADNAAHYLAQVMRVKPGDGVLVFDDRGGEWLARVEAVGRRQVVLRCDSHIRPREPVPDLWLAAAPIRKARFDWVAEKACELGVARFVPVLTRRAVVDKVKTDKLRAHMIEAAEQCGRTALPEVADAMTLACLLDSLEGRFLFFADETCADPRQGNECAPGVLTAARANAGPAALLIGPEGGFDPEEQATIRACPRAISVTLGPRILRADTAAVAAVTLWMAAHIGSHVGSQ